MLSIGLILPEVLGTYGDDGNALVLRQRARLRGMAAEIVPVHLGEAIPESLDIYCLGGGEDTAQVLAAEQLTKDPGLRRAAAAGRPIFAICAGFQVLGESFRAAGKIVDGVGLIDATTSGLERRAIGELVSTPVALGLTEALTGFENHLGATILGPGAQPLGRVVSGVGNCDKHCAEDMPDPEAHTSAEGAVQGSVIATYMHGPALARNPQLADLLLEKATGETLEPLEIPAVTQLRKERLATA